MPLVLPESQGAQSTPPLSSASSSVYRYPISSVSASPSSTPPLPSSASPLSIGVAAHSALQQQAHHNRILQPFPSPRPASSSSFFPPASAAAAAAQTAVAPAAFPGSFRSLPIAAITNPSHSTFRPSESAQVLSPVSLPDMDQPRPSSGPSSQYPAPRRQDEPIDDHEWVYVFTEIIRQARDRGQPLKFASQILFDAIRDANINPTWEELSLPGGRTLRSYQEAYWNFQGPGLRYTQQQPKRPLPFDPANQTGRLLAPKPVQPGPPEHHTLGGPSPTTMGPLAGTQTFSPEQRRRRGRPSKKEQEERRRRLSESGRAHIPPPLQPTSAGYGVQQQQQPRMAGPGEVPQSPAPSAPSLAGMVVATPQGPGTQSHRQNSNSGGSNGSRNKKRARPPNPSTEILQEAPPPPTFGGAAEQQRHAPAGGEIQGGGGQTTSRDERRASEGSSRGPYGASSVVSEAQGAEQDDGSKSVDLRKILNN